MAIISSTSSGTTSIGGLISGLDIESIVAKLSEVENRVVQRYQTQQTTLAAKQAAFQNANLRLGALKSASAKLSGATFFSTFSATADDSSVTASSGSGATAGEYQLTVGTVARAHQVLSQSYTDVTATRLGTGTFTVTSGGQATAITLDSSNNTLGGLRDAINAANTNVRASIVQDGDSSYRLLVSSKNTGTANSLTISSTLAGGTAPGLTDLQTAQDATLTLGSGAAAISITRSNNSIRDLIPGVTVNLTTASAGKAVTVTVAQDKETITKGVQDFVDQYNNTLDFLNAQFKFNADSSTGGTLIGDFTLQGIQNKVQTIFSAAVSGLGGSVNSLVDLGITTAADGKLSLSTTKFQEVLAADPSSVASVFALTGKSSNAAIQFVGATENTVAQGVAYAVNITQAAKQSRVTSGVAQTGVLDAAETLTVNGTAISLSAGMTQADVVTAINSRANTTGVIARATAADGTGTGTNLSFFAVGYGSKGKVSVVSDLSNGAGITSGIGNVTATEVSTGGEGGAGTGEVGLDVAGTINGEAATGSGQTLIGAIGNANTEGLSLIITSETTGALGTIQVYGGAAHAANKTLAEITDSTDGVIATETQSLEDRSKGIQEIIERLQATNASNTDRMRKKFNAMEVVLSRLQSQSASILAMNNARSSDN